MTPGAALRGPHLADEFRVELGDRRRLERVLSTVAAMESSPEVSYPQMMGSAGLEGFYRLLANTEVSGSALRSGHHSRTAARCDEVSVALAIHDTTTFSFPDHGTRREHLDCVTKQSQGFWGHFSLAASADGVRAPLGVLDTSCYVHERQVDGATNEWWRQEFGRAFDSEGARWVAGFVACEERVSENTTLIHVCDREADRIDTLVHCIDGRHGFVIRSFRDWRSAGDQTVQSLLDSAPVLACRQLSLSARSITKKPHKSRTFPERERRRALVEIKAVRAEVRLGEHVRTLHVVDVIEPHPPGEEAPIHWRLLTDRAIKTVSDVLLVIDIYRSRWLIEEFFKAIKTGCSFEKRQLNSAEAIVIALALTVPVAWKLLALRHLSRHEPEMLAKSLLTKLQLQILQKHAKKGEWSREPKIGQAMTLIARLGGHLKRNAAPGWLVLGRGYQKLLDIEQGVLLARTYGDLIDE
jgi:hypothetical protein